LLEHGPCEHHRRSFAPVREAHARFGVVLPAVAAEVLEAAAAEQGVDAPPF
jgi:ribonuclease HII